MTDTDRFEAALRIGLAQLAHSEPAPTGMPERLADAVVEPSRRGGSPGQADDAEEISRGDRHGNAAC